MRVRRVLVTIASSLFVLVPVLAHAQQKFVAALRSEQEVPANPSTATGTCTVTLIGQAENGLSVTCNYTGLGSPLIAGHIHGAGAVGVNAPVIIDLAAPTGDTSGTFTAAPLDVTPAQVLALRSNLLYINLHTTGFPAGEIRGQLKSTKTVFDLDGEGRTDLTIFRPSTATFWTQRSLSGGLTTHVFGQTTGENWVNSIPGEWDGDGIADYALIRFGPAGNYIWSIFESRTGTVRIVTWGTIVPSTDSITPADYDGDGILDIALFRPLTGVWYIMQSSTGTARIESFGTPGDGASVGDYDGDGRADLTVVRGTGGQLEWWTRRSSDGQINVTQWGTQGDVPLFFAPIDVDGDGRQDIMIQRIVSGQRLCIIRRSSDGAAYFLPWGLAGDSPLFGDYDGDGRTDFVARRNIGGHLLWFIYQSSNGQVRYVYWGITGDQ